MLNFLVVQLPTAASLRMLRGCIAIFDIKPAGRNQISAPLSTAISHSLKIGVDFGGQTALCHGQANPAAKSSDLYFPMKARHRFLPLLAISASFATAATNQYWNVGSTGGDGIWGTGPGDKNWNLTPGAAAGNTTWADPTDNIAVFQDAGGGTVTVFDPVQTNGLSQTGANYTLDAGVITLVSDAASAAPFVSVQTGTLTVNSALAGTSGLVKTGAANLLLTAANPFTGPTAVNAGTLTLTGSLASTGVQIASGATLTDANGGLATATALTNAGTLVVNAAETIASLTNNAGTVNGTSVLTVTGPTTFTGGTLGAPLTLNGTGGGTFTNAILAGTFNGTAALDGATVSGTLSGPTTSTGNTLVSGNIGGGSLAVNGGLLTLTGTSTNISVTVAAGAGLVDQSGGLDAATVLANAGTLTVNAADTIATYTQASTGALTGTGFLTASGGATLNGGTISGNLLGNTASNLDVLISGSLGGGSLAVNGGTLTLTGTSTNASVMLAAGAGLVDQSGGLDTATVLANAGTLSVNSADTIASLTNTGGTVNGSGTLTVTGPCLFNGGTLAAPLTVNGTGGGTFTNALLAGTFNGTAALDGATVSGVLSGPTTSIGNTLVSGNIGGGLLAVTGGTLTLTGTSTNPTVNLAAGSGLVDQTGGLDASSVLTNAGTLTVNAADTITSLTNNAGTVNGAGTLTVTGPSLFNGGTLAAPLTLNGTGGGTFANALLAGTFNGTAALDGATVSGTLNGPATSIGNTLVSGAIGGGSLAVNGGTLTLTGTSTNTPVTVALGANLVDQGNLSDTAAVTNAGHFSVNTADTITSLTNNAGTVNGTGTLTVTGPTLFNGGTLATPLTVNGTSGGTFTNATIAGTFNGTAALDGATVSGTLSGTTTSTGNTLVSGSIGGGSLNVTGGMLNLTGTSTNNPVTIGTLATLVDANGGLATTAALTNAGILTVNSADTITSLANNAGTVNGTGTLNVTGATIFTGGTLAAPLTINGNGGGSFTNATIAGVFNGNTTSNGNTLVSGSIGGGSLNVAGGTLNLTGSSINNPVTIGALATLVDANGGLANTAAITNAGFLTVNAADTIATYLSNGSSLTGTGLLTTTSATLNTGSSVSGYLSAGTLTSNGAVAITGSATAASFSIASGVLTNTGTLAATVQLNITGGATLIAGGTQTYNLLTTSGAGAGTWQGNLNNPTTVAPGGAGATGTLAVTGQFSNAPGGTLKLDLGAGGHDLVTVGGTATFGGTLDLNQLSPIAPFVPVQVVAAGSYAGNFTTLAENLDGAAWFNPGNGTVMTLALPTAGGSTLYGTTANQTAVWVSLYDDVIDPAATNVTYTPGGGYTITSGIANAGNPDLLNALAASFVAGGLNTAVLNRLSPEVYGGFQDYAIQATRSHQRAALDAPSLGFIQAPRNPHAAGSKDAQAAPPAANPWEYFAAVDYFDTATDSSPNGADYGLSGYGFIAGARTTLSERVRLGGYVAADSGKLDGTLIDADVEGWSLGLFAKALVHERTHTVVSGGLSYGSYSFDGTRGSLIATGGGGWTPASASFSNVDSDALELFLGISSLMYQDHGFRLLPAAGLRYVSGSMDGFAETSGATGSPIALVVDRDSYQHALAELSLRAEADVTATLTLDGLLGVSVGLGGDDPAGLNARFATGSRPFRATAAGLDDDAVFLGLGANWRIRDNFAMGLHWRADFREDADMENTVGLSTSIRF